MILLVDNGSTRAAATLSLRHIATGLESACGRTVHAVSLQHADRISPAQLDGRPAEVLPAFLAHHLARGEREFITVPLFFGRSRALTSFIPEQVGLLAERFGAFDLRQADVLSPLQQGEPRLTDILADNVAQCCAQMGAQADRVILVDHGSPLPEVTAVRAQLALGLRGRLAEEIALSQAVMERRKGAAYDFNGMLLGDLLDSAAAPDRATHVVLAMLFISPGRHAGAGGDIEEICRDAEARNPGLQVGISGLVGQHPGLIEILQDRLNAVL